MKKSVGFRPEHVIIRLTMKCILYVNVPRVGMGKDIVGCSVAEVSSEAFSVEERKFFHTQDIAGVREGSPCTEA